MAVVLACGTLAIKLVQVREGQPEREPSHSNPSSGVRQGLRFASLASPADLRSAQENRPYHPPSVDDGETLSAPELPSGLLSVEDANALESYWVALIRQRPQEALMQLNSEPDLLGTLGFGGIDALFDHFGYRLLEADFLQLERMTDLESQLRDKALERLFELDSEVMTDSVLALPLNSPLRERGLYSVIDSWQRADDGVAFLEYTYGLQDPQLNALLIENYGNYQFADPVAQMKWIHHQDYLGLFRSHITSLADQVVGSRSMVEVHELIEAGPYSEQLAAAAQERLGERKPSNEAFWDWLQDRR